MNGFDEHPWLDFWKHMAVDMAVMFLGGFVGGASGMAFVLYVVRPLFEQFMYR